MLFGLKKAAPTFQRFIDEVLRRLDFAFAYINDILISSSNHEEHQHHLRTIFDKLKVYGVILNPSKCIFEASQIDFLGYRVDKQGTTPLPEKTEALRDFPKPTTARTLRRYLGMFTFYRRFIPKESEIQAPLTSLLLGQAKGNKPIS